MGCWKWCRWFGFDRELEEICRGEVFHRGLVGLVVEHLNHNDDRDDDDDDIIIISSYHLTT